MVRLQNSINFLKIPTVKQAKMKENALIILCKDISINERNRRGRLRQGSAIETCSLKFELAAFLSSKFFMIAEVTIQSAENVIRLNEKDRL
jgi:hypothetical protein